MLIGVTLFVLPTACAGLGQAVADCERGMLTALHTLVADVGDILKPPPDDSTP